MVCFAAGTLILTPDGERRVEDLRVGDLVSTRDSGAQRILWMSSRALGPDALEAQPELRPVVLEARWTGSGQRILLSPQHAVLVMTSRFPDGRIVRAAQLARSRGGAVRVAQGVRHVTFHHFMLPRHEIVYANGMAAESFFPGSRAVGALEPSDRLTLLELFPGHAPGELAAAYGGPRVPYARSRDLPNDLSGLSPDRVPALSGPGIVSAQKAAVADRSSAQAVPSRSPERPRG